MERAEALAASTPGETSPVDTLLLIEDDLADAFLVQSHLKDAATELTGALGDLVGSLAEAEPRLRAGDIDCVLLDLQLPDSSGLPTLERVVALAPELPVIVLTGLRDREAGMSAVAAGAQDYLVKGEVDGEQILRSVRYACERTLAATRLIASETGRARTARVLRGLLPRPLVSDEALRWGLRYLPGGAQVEVGGDFVDVIERPDGTLRVVIGDVCGHGPDEAAVGAGLRIAWRTLVLSGIADSLVLGGLEAVLVAERTDELFATVCDLTITADRSQATIRLAGHPTPIILRGDGQPEIRSDQRGLPIGVLDDATWPDVVLDLPPRGALLCFTDGLIEGAAPEDRMLGEKRLCELASSIDFSHPEAGLDTLIAQVQAANGGPLDDDVAALLLCLG